MNERALMTEQQASTLGVYLSDGLRWHCHTRATLSRPGETTPFLTVEQDGNALLLGGASMLWEGLKGGGTTSTGSAKKFFNATAALGLGNSSAAVVNTQINLQGASKKYKVMSAGFPTHTTSSTASTASKFVAKSTYTTTEANFSWKEWGLFNKVTTGATQRMLNRKASSGLLTKTSAATASLTVTLSLA